MNKTQDQLALLVEEYLVRVQTGTLRHRSDLVDRAGDAAAELNEMLDAVDAMEGFPASTATADPSTNDGSWALEPVRLGEFTIVREVGRGGMGVVYAAVQESLGRSVALKVLPSSRMDEQSAVRFEREALAAARLHHTNIVAVFSVGVGETPAGPVKYMAMPFIDGENLSTQLKHGIDVPQDGRERARWAAQIGVQIAEAVDYAHRQGVLHRDVKPGNVMVDKTGHAWLVDFGVAKLCDDTDPLTRDDAVAGTLRYLAPERLRGEASRRSDVYALGATLYEMAAGRAPFPETDRVKLLDLIANREPQRLSHCVEGVPVDFCRVVAKAMAKNPDERYDCAAELAADLRRFLDGEPVNARPLSWRQSASRWLRRHPLVASLSTATALSLIAGTSIATWQALRASAAEKIASTRKQDAERQAALANDRYDLAASAVDLFLNRIMDRPEWSKADFQPLFRDLLSQAIPYYEKLAADHSDDPSRTAARAEALLRLAAVEHRLGRQSNSLARFQEASDVYEGLTETFPEDHNLRYRHALALTHSANALNDARRVVESRRLHERAWKSFEQLAAAFPNVGDYQSGLAASTTNLANLSRDAGDLKGAADEYTRAERMLLELRSAADSPTRYDRDLAETLRNLAYTRQHLLQLDEAKAIYLRLIPLEESILARSPEDPTAMLAVAASQHNFGEMLHYLRDLPEAKARLARAVELRGKAADLRPSITEFRADLAHSQTSLGDILSDLGEAAAAESIQEAALKTREALAVQHPEVAEYKIGLVKSLRVAARWSAARKDWSTAHQHLDRADSILSAVDGQHDAELRRNHRYLQDSQVVLLTGEAADHASHDRWSDAISRLERVAGFPNSSPGVQLTAIKEWSRIAEARPAERDRCYSGITTLLASLLAQQRLSAAHLNELRAAVWTRAYLASPAAKPLAAQLANPQPR